MIDPPKKASVPMDRRFFYFRNNLVIFTIYSPLFLLLFMNVCYSIRELLWQIPYQIGGKNPCCATWYTSYLLHLIISKENLS